MKKTICALTFLVILLAGCGTSETAVDTPTIKPTATQLPPTPTPEPTATLTPTPEPTSTPTPTPEPTLMPISELIEELEVYEIADMMDAEAAEYEAGYYRWAIGLANSLLDTWIEDYPYLYINRAGSYSKLGDFENAIKDLETAAQLPYMDQVKRSLEEPETFSQLFTEDEVNDIGNMYNNLCWYLAITDQPQQALPYCEESVSLFPSIAIKDSLAVVYGMLGRTEESISEFEQVLEMAEDDPFGFYSEMVEERQQWLTELQNGENPFTPETLEKLRQESIDPNAYPEPEFLEDYSGQHFYQILEQDGFILVDSGVNDSGSEYKFYGLIAGECMIRVIFFDSDQEFSQAKMILNGCEEDQYVAELRWFVKLLLLNDPRMDTDCISLGEWRAWELTELQKLISGEIEESQEITLRQIKFMAIREVDEENSLWITLYGYK